MDTDEGPSELLEIAHMPRVALRNAEREMVDSYQAPLPLGLYAWDRPGVAAVKRMRADAEQVVQALTPYIRDDRSLKEMVKEAKRQAKAATLVLNLASRVDQREHGYFPHELASELDEAFNWLGP